MTNDVVDFNAYRLTAGIVLKRCPFCGGEASLRTDVSLSNGDGWIVGCDDLGCGARLGAVQGDDLYGCDTPGLAADRWNKRGGRR